MQKTETQPKTITKVFDLPPCECTDQSCSHRVSFSQAIHEIEKGFSKGYCPKLADEGTSGCYMLRGKSRRPVAVFKPIDEE
jgi:hypothetical protein